MLRRVEIAALAIIFAILAVGLALVPLEFPWFTRTLSASYSELPDSTALPLAEKTRAFVIQNDAGGKAAVESEMPSALAHLEDVRLVIAGANRATAVLLVIAVIWAGLQWRMGSRRKLAAALTGAAWVVGGATVLLVVTAVVSFDAFFSAFHGLFFSSGTWVFPSDSLLIRLFPERFWSTAGLVWGILVLVICGALTVLGRALSGARNK